MDEQFASHQDIRSQLNKIMKVGIMSHSDDAVPEGPNIGEGDVSPVQEQMAVLNHPTNQVPGETSPYP